MAQFRQSGLERGVFRNSGPPDHVSIGVGSSRTAKQSRIHRRFKTHRNTSVGAFILILSLIFLVSLSAFLYLSRDNNKETNNYDAQDDDLGNDTDFLTNVTRTESYKVLKFGHGSVIHGRDSRYWDRDDRRRDEDYSEDLVEHASMGTMGGSVEVRLPAKGNKSETKSSAEYGKSINRKGGGLYNEAGRNELKMYEAQYEASLKNAGQSRNETKRSNKVPNDTDIIKHDEEVGDDYDDEIDTHNSLMEDYEDTVQVNSDNFDVEKSHGVGKKESFDSLRAGRKDTNIGRAVEEASLELSDEASLNSSYSEKLSDDAYGQSARRAISETRFVSKKMPKRRKFSGSCEMKFINSTAQLVEPLESRKFARFSLQYTDVEENSNGLESWEPRFVGHQSLQEREQSFIAHDQKINCGFVKSPNGSPSTGFDLAEDDAKYISTCHIAVISCIFGNSDLLRTPMSKTVSRLSRKNVCFVMFIDEVTLQTLSSEGQMPDRMGFVGIWKIVVVKNLPYTDMRRVGKIPKLLPHRLFPSARYSSILFYKLLVD